MLSYSARPDAANTHRQRAGIVSALQFVAGLTNDRVDADRQLVRAKGLVPTGVRAIEEFLHVSQMVRCHVMGNYLYIAATIALTVYGQLVLKMQVTQAGPLPELGSEKLMFLVRLLLNPWVISAFAAAFLASVTWMGAMSKFQLSHATHL